MNILSKVGALGLMVSLGCAVPQYVVMPVGAPVNADGPGARAVAIIRVPIPWYAPRFLVRSKFRDALPEYERLQPLEAKYFSISDDGRYGGLYLWTDRAAANAHFDTVWRAGVRARRGVDADVVILDAPYVIEGRATPIGKPMRNRTLEYPASASLVQWRLPSSADASVLANVLAHSSWTSEAMIRAIVVADRGSVGVLTLWANRAAAEAAVADDSRRVMGNLLSATDSTFTLFEAPLLIDQKLRTASDIATQTNNR